MRKTSRKGTARMTVVINLFGGSGLGKSTTGALTFGEMKLQGFHVELVREYVKKWAWLGIKPSVTDQFYLAGKQWHAESHLYGKLDYLVTDSPVLLAGFYEQHFGGEELCLPAILNHQRRAEKDKDVKYLNLFLQRHKAFDTRGRYETAEQAAEIDVALREWLTKHDISFIDLEAPDRERPQAIINLLKENGLA